jgi:predicted O-methyltransferase YrrM
MIKKILTRYRRWLVEGLARQEDLDRLYDQIGGLAQISAAMRGDPVLKPLRGWAISPDAMAWILACLQEFDQPTVVEFGSGQSTVILAAVLKHCGGRLLSVEHDGEYSDTVQRQVAACGLASHVDFLHAPLHDADDATPIRSYNMIAVPEIAANLILVDGPPYTNGTLTRLVPLRWAIKHLKKEGVIFLDDTIRKGEQTCLRQLKNEHQDLLMIERVAEKGLIELRFAR